MYFGIRLTGEDKTVYLPGMTSDGHYQIEMSCVACHSDPFGSGEVLQEACIKCHGQELKIADDSHPKSKFTDPRNADRVAQLDARKCVTCHVEHKKEITREMGVTVPDDVCYKCHKDVATDRPSHKGMKFTTCASAGCHNFHDNTALYEDFLAKHLDEPVYLNETQNKQLSGTKAHLALSNYPVERYPVVKLQSEKSDRPHSVRKDPKILQDWLSTSHSQAGVNCTACHEQQSKNGTDLKWVDHPTYEVCANCHDRQSKGFLSGKHGMRLAQNLQPMTPGIARLPMKKTSANKELTCNSCHGAHQFDRQHAAVEACFGCHSDRHSLAYKESPHFGLWQQELNGIAQKGSGVSCATCHLPRKNIKHGGKEYVVVEHNQNDNLRPNEKMLREVCMQCHGLGFSIDALADEQLIENNFKGKPGVHIESLDLAKKRLNLKKDVEGM